MFVLYCHSDWKRSIYSNKIASTLAKNWHLTTAHRYITSLFMTSLAIAVHDVQYAVEVY